jgi:hypothetical protein
MAGLGDRIAAATKAVGIRPCAGCRRRQAWLNRHFPGRQPQLPAGFEERASAASAGRIYLLAEHRASHAWVVWERLSGRLVNGHYFCAAAGAEDAARQRFQQLLEESSHA